MRQSRAGSAVEAIVNTAAGYVVAFGLQHLVFPLVGVPPLPPSSHHAIAVSFTVASLIRSYGLRRWFESRAWRWCVARLSALTGRVTKWLRSKDCPECSKPMDRAMYMAIPVWLCPDEDCRTTCGFWSVLWTWVPFNGWCVVYPIGTYWRTLWAWLTTGPDEGGDEWR